MAGRPPALPGVPWEPPHNFMGLEGERGALDTSRAVLLPVPYESTTSWGGGARLGPAAILEASRYIELYDREHDDEPARHGIHTLPAVELTRAGSTEAMAELEETVLRVLEHVGERFLLMVGGEHSISAPAIRATAARRRAAEPDAPRPSVLQMDAHADLRDGYQGAPWSHASFARRALDVADFVQVGLRGVDREEVELIRNEPAITAIWAEETQEGDGWMDRALEALGPEVYLTFDVDFFDPSLVPATGTPEPGGGDWYRTLRFLRRVFRERRVLGADVVEHAPIPGLRAPDFLVAKLVYKVLGYHFEADG